MVDNALLMSLGLSALGTLIPGLPWLLWNKKFHIFANKQFLLGFSHLQQSLDQNVVLCIRIFCVQTPLVDPFVLQATCKNLWESAWRQCYLQPSQLRLRDSLKNKWLSIQWSVVTLKGRKSKKGGIYVYVWLVHFATQQKRTQYSCVCTIIEYSCVCTTIEYSCVFTTIQYSCVFITIEYSCKATMFQWKFFIKGKKKKKNSWESWRGFQSRLVRLRTPSMSSRSR